jgi:hypothetical protein
MSVVYIEIVLYCHRLDAIENYFDVVCSRLDLKTEEFGFFKGHLVWVFKRVLRLSE